MENTQFIDPYKLVTDAIIAQLEKGVVPWRCPWRREVGKPRNFNTGKEYRGINVILLNISRFASPYWLTFNQVKARGGKVLKGERGSFVVKYGTFKKKVAGEGGTEEEKKLGYLKGYRVFNALQVSGIEFPEAPSVEPIAVPERLVKADAIIEGIPSPPNIREGKRSAAFYRKSTDSIEMPARKSFESPEAFYITLFHELVHSTGHQTRLNRQTLVESDGTGGKVYSEEELVAEVGAAFLGTEAEIIRDEHEQSAAYLKGWMDILGVKEHRRWIVRSANAAAKAADFILNRMPAELEQEPEAAAA